MSEKRCGNCVHYNARDPGPDEVGDHGDCPFFANFVPAVSKCERWFGMDELRAAAYGKKPKPQREMFE